jgi:hypothetical protein
VLDLVAERHQPQRIPARSPVNVRHGGRYLWQATMHDLGGSGEPQQPMARAQPVALPARSKDARRPPSASMTSDCATRRHQQTAIKNS